MTKRKLKILISAGPTREPLDPVRFISNYSTGQLGYEIACQAKKRAHQVILVSGKTALPKPKGTSFVEVETAQQMRQQLRKKFPWCDCLIMTAAVSDFRPKNLATKKIKRAKKGLILRLKPNPDILKDLALRKSHQFLVGFALESENLQKNAQRKLREKKLDLIVATQIKPNSYPFGPSRIAALIMDQKGGLWKVKKVAKERLARILLDSIERSMLR